MLAGREAAWEQRVLSGSTASQSAAAVSMSPDFSPRMLSLLFRFCFLWLQNRGEIGYKSSWFPVSRCCVLKHRPFLLCWEMAKFTASLQVKMHPKRGFYFFTWRKYFYPEISVFRFPHQHVSHDLQKLSRSQKQHSIMRQRIYSSLEQEHGLKWPSRLLKEKTLFLPKLLALLCTVSLTMRSLPGACTSPTWKPLSGLIQSLA